jgi:hypothetical protein
VGTGAVSFVEPEATQSIRQALAALNTNYLATLDKTESEIGRVLATSAARQAQVIIGNLDAFERDGSQIFATSRNLAVLQQLTEALSELDVPVRNQAQAIWTARAADLQQALEKYAPALGIKLGPTDFGRTSFEQIHVGANNAFSELSDFAQLQSGVLVNLKTGLGDSMARGLDWRSIGKQAEATGIEALAAIPGFRRAFSLEERGQMIARTETVRINTQLQDVFGEEAGLEWGRSYLNWALATHSELCLWAESIGWAPVTDFLSGPGLPPRHTNCVLPGQLVSGPAAEAGMSRWYEGEAVEITTEGNQHIALTVGHPVLTPLGWVAAKAIHEGDDVMSCPGAIAVDFVHPHYYQVPTSIEDILRALREKVGVAPVTVGLSDVDFHGDGCSSKVCVVWADGLLRHAVEPTRLHVPSKQSFRIGGVAKRHLHAPGSPNQIFATAFRPANGVMSGAGPFLLFGFGQSTHRQAGRLGGVSEADSGSYQSRTDWLSGNPKPLGQRQDRLATQVAADDFFVGEKDSALLREMCKPQRVINARHFRYRGHVYNLQTKGGWFAVNGITTKNCGCSWQRGSPDWLDKGHSVKAASEFIKMLKSDDIKISADLLSKLPASIRAKVADAVKAGASKKLIPPSSSRPFEQLKEIPRLNPAPEPAPVVTMPTFSSIAHKEIGAGVKTVEHAARVGALVDKEWTSRVGIRRTAFEGDIQASEARAQAFRADMDAAVARLAALPSGHAEAPELRKTWRQRVDERNAEAKKTEALRDQLATLNRESLRDMIAELRALGSVEQQWAKGTTGKAKAAVAAISGLIPTSWLEASRLFGELQGRTVQRGFYRHMTGAPSVLAVSDRGVLAHGFEGTALHEMGHRFERTNSVLLQLERELYEQRTKGDSLQWMGSGFRRNEVTRKDNWTDRYMGKDYKGVAYELLSMALESVYYGTYDLRKDEGMLHWVLGLLAGA